MTTKTKERKVKAWVILETRSEKIYDVVQRKPDLKGYTQYKVTPCTITYSLPSKKK